MKLVFLEHRDVFGNYKTIFSILEKRARKLKPFMSPTFNLHNPRSFNFHTLLAGKGFWQYQLG
jgi:hypothetical protein